MYAGTGRSKPAAVPSGAASAKRRAYFFGGAASSPKQEDCDHDDRLEHDDDCPPHLWIGPVPGRVPVPSYQAPDPSPPVQPVAPPPAAPRGFWAWLLGW